MKFNPLEHDLVPEHILLSEDEEDAILRKLRVEKEQLPKIKRTDPVVRILEKVHGPIEEGRIIKVVRASKTAGVAEAYRLVVKR